MFPSEGAGLTERAEPFYEIWCGWMNLTRRNQEVVAELLEDMLVCPGEPLLRPQPEIPDRVTAGKRGRRAEV